MKGRELDLYIWSCNEALAFGRRSVQVTILRLGWDPQNSAPSAVDRSSAVASARARGPEPRRPLPRGAPASSARRRRHLRRRRRRLTRGAAARPPRTVPCAKEASSRQKRRVCGSPAKAGGRCPGVCYHPGLMHALYIVLPALCILAIAYRYYSAFLATKVWMLDDARTTPAHTKYDGANYYPTSQVGDVRPPLRGHHRRRTAGRPDAGGAVRLRARLHLAGRRRVPRRRGPRRMVLWASTRRGGQVAARHRQAGDQPVRGRRRRRRHHPHPGRRAGRPRRRRSSTRWPTARGAPSPSP